MDEAESNIGNVTLGFIHVQLYSTRMDARHPKPVVGLTTVCYMFQPVFFKCISDEDLKWFKKCCVETRAVYIEVF
jgi:hypothetical protein